MTQLPDGTHRALAGQARDVPATVTIPTVVVPSGNTVSIPTVTIPQPTATPTPTPTPRPKPKPKAPQHPAPKPTPVPPQRTWIWAFLTSYCPASAGWQSSSGLPTFYGMLANDYYPFGTHVYMPVIGMTGVVEDRIGSYGMWNHFDVWSPVCYSTPTGWFKIAVLTGR
jgi:hypothetical protein